MKQLVWSPSSINFGSRKKGESVTAESTLSITEGSALLTPGKISPLPGADYPVQIKNTEGNLHIHPAFSFAAARYYLTSAGVLTTNRDIAELYLGNANAGEGLPLLPVPITLVITTPPGEIDPADPLTINYTSSAVLWVKVFFKVNDSEWFFYDIFNATGTFDMDISEWGFSHGDILTIKVQDDESTSFYDTVAFDVMVKNIVIDSIGTIYLIGEFEDGVDYYATPDGEITTDITGIYLGVGNADGDIDLDIIEYAVEITSPVASADIALDVPFNVTATTNLQDGREVLIYAKKTGVTEHIGTATVSGGAISESVSIPSSAFTAEDTVTIELNYASGAVTDSNDVVCPNLLAITSYTLSIFSGNDIVIEGTFDDIEDITVTIKQGLITKSIVVPVVLGSWTATINASILDGFVVNQWLDIEAVSGVYTRTINNATYIKPTVTITTPLNNARVVEMGVPITVSGVSDGKTVDIISIDKYGHQYEFVTGLEVVLGAYTYDITFNDTDFDPEAVSYPLGVRDSIYLFPTEITLLPPSQFAVITPTNYTIIDTDSQFDAECLSEFNVDVYCSTLKGGRFFIGTLISDGTSAVGTLTIDNALVGTGHTEINGTSRGESALRNLIFISDGVEISIPCIVSGGKTHGLGVTNVEVELRGDDGFTIGTTNSTGEKI